MHPFPHSPHFIHSFTSAFDITKDTLDTQCYKVSEPKSHQFSLTDTYTTAMVACRFVFHTFLIPPVMENIIRDSNCFKPIPLQNF